MEKNGINEACQCETITVKGIRYGMGRTIVLVLKSLQQWVLFTAFGLCWLLKCGAAAQYIAMHLLSQNHLRAGKGDVGRRGDYCQAIGLI